MRRSTIARLCLHSGILLLTLTALPSPLQAQARPYSLSDIVELLKGRWAGTDILGMVREDCISFRVTDDAEATLRRNGADQALLSGLRSVCNRAPAAKQAPPPPPRGIVEIEGELPPGWFRSVNDLPPSTNRRIDLTPGREARIVVSSRGWCPARMTVTLKSAEERRWTPTLQPRPWVGECP